MAAAHPTLKAEGANFGPNLELVNSKRTDPDWNPALRSFLRSVLANGQYTQNRCLQAGWGGLRARPPIRKQSHSVPRLTMMMGSTELGPMGACHIPTMVVRPPSAVSALETRRGERLGSNSFDGSSLKDTKECMRCPRASNRSGLRSQVSLSTRSTMVLTLTNF